MQSQSDRSFHFLPLSFPLETLGILSLFSFSFNLFFFFQFLLSFIWYARTR